MRGAVVPIASAVAVLTIVDPVDAVAQGARWRPVARADVFAAAIDAAHLGVGVTTEVAPYVRVDAAVGAGAARGTGEWLASGRGEITGRFLLDPFRQSRWGPYVGAGLIVRFEETQSPRGLMALSVGTEVPADGRWTPAIELGYGGGLRAGVIVRRGRPGRR